MSSLNRDKIERLCAVSGGLPPRPVAKTVDIDQILGDCWTEFDGHDEHGREPYKLLGRIANIE